MGRALFAVEHTRYRAALDGDPVGNGAAGIGKQRFDGPDRLGERGDDGRFTGRLAGSVLGGGKRHGWLR